MIPWRGPLTFNTFVGTIGFRHNAGKLSVLLLAYRVDTYPRTACSAAAPRTLVVGGKGRFYFASSSDHVMK